jgi:ribosomal subunit interface protein
MQTKVKATDYEMTPETTEYLDTRIAALEKLVDADDESAMCEVEIGRDGGKKQHSDHLWCVEIRIIAAGVNVYAKNRAPSVHAAIDDVREEVERQLRQGKGKKAALNKKAGKSFKDWLRFGK